MFSLGNSSVQNADGTGLQPGPGDHGASPEFVIPANTATHSETQVFTISEGTTTVPLLGIAGHALLAGTSVRISVERNQAGHGASSECLLDTPRYDMNWQRMYVIDSAIDTLPTLSEGDRVRIECSYDNTLSNDRLASALEAQHRNATVDMYLGDQALDEMCVGAFLVLVPTAPVH
jgi:hypothetical protein